MIVVLIILLAILGGLLLLYLKISQPPADVTGKAQVKGVDWVRSIYGYGRRPAEMFNSPIGVGVDSRGRIFAADSQNGRVLIFRTDGSYVGRLGKSGLTKGSIAFPQGVDVGPNGDIYVTDTKRQVLMVFGPDLRFKDEIHGLTPLSVWATRDKIYLTTMQHVVVLDANLRVLEKWGKRGKAIGDFDFPHGVVALKNGLVVVSDGNNMRIQALMNGKGQAAWVLGAPPGSVFTKSRIFGLPGGMCLDANQNIYVMDPLSSTVHVLNDKGKQLGEYGEFGQEDGQFNYPSDIAYAGADEFVVSDTFNNRLQVVKIGGGAVATTPPESLWDRLKDYWWCGLLALLLLLAMLIVFFRRRGEALPQ